MKETVQPHHISSIIASRSSALAFTTNFRLGFVSPFKVRLYFYELVSGLTSSSDQRIKGEECIVINGWVLILCLYLCCKCKAERSVVSLTIRMLFYSQFIHNDKQFSTWVLMPNHVSSCYHQMMEMPSLGQTKTIE